MHVIQPKIRGLICVNAHPSGCAFTVQDWIRSAQGITLDKKPQTVLVIGASTGYGLATRIISAFSGNAATYGVSFEKSPRAGKPASAGWYNNRAFGSLARREGLHATTMEADAFADTTKHDVIAALAANGHKVDLLVYSLASPARMHPRTGKLHRSVLKPIDTPFKARTLDIWTGEVSRIELPPATEQEIEDTIAVMGGEDWRFWIDALAEARLLTPDFQTLAYTYLGSEITWPIYWHGTIGRAKADLDRVAANIRRDYHADAARVVALKAVVTQASTAIPVVPLYGAALMKTMTSLGLEEGCFEQIGRLFTTRTKTRFQPDDDADRIRMDDLELSSAVQDNINEIWPSLNTRTVADLTDLDGFRAAFLRIFGFGHPRIDYEKPVNLFQISDGFR